jgi:hypothetical protein
MDMVKGVEVVFLALPWLTLVAGSALLIKGMVKPGKVQKIAVRVETPGSKLDKRR